MDSASTHRARRIVPTLSFFLILAAAHSATHPMAFGQDAEWIWAPTRKTADQVAGPCYFRKSFVLRGPQKGEIKIAGDQRYSLHVNGVRLGVGEDWKKLDRYDIGPYLVKGRNVIAVEANKSEPGQAGLVATVTLRNARNQTATLTTDVTWKTHLRAQVGWNQVGFNDGQWSAARSLGKYGKTEPWQSQRDQVATQKKSRFQVTPQFRVESVAKAEKIPSLLAMSFDEFGNILASREGGPLLLVRDTNGDKIPDTVTTYCDKVKNCQGILSMNGEVYVTADGDDGCAMYRLTDEDRNGVIDQVTAVVRFKGKIQEHGPHGLRLGPDGMIYLMCGNMTRITTPISPTSPFKHYYEGDLVGPRHEDPRGHASGIKAPGGTVLRIDPSTGVTERFAGGLRNAYDLAFNRDGQLFTWDSDMERDQGMTWYRPTRINHLIAGSESGWRSGWAKWPAYYVDSLPGILETGGGSPTGVVAYQHFMYPARYQDTLFVGDWTRGQILNVRLTKQGAGYTARSNVFVEGSPLNITDLEVGPDGWLYFCTGGRGSEGGLFRVVWTGNVPPEVQDLGEGIDRALRQPQFHTAWARQRVAVVKRSLGDQWDKQLVATANKKTAPIAERIRALDLMHLYGPFPSPSLLLNLANDRDPSLRAKVAYLMGLHHEETMTERLTAMLDDPDASVRRHACESIVRGNYATPIAALLPLLGERDRFLAWSAAKALQQAPTEQWKDNVLRSTDQRVVLVGSAALLAANPDVQTARDVLHRLQVMMKGFVADSEFIDLLRTCQIALSQGGLQANDVPDLVDLLVAEFPAGNAAMNRELVRLLAFLETTSVTKKYIAHFQSDLASEDKLHLAAHAPYFVEGMSTAQRFEWLKYYAAGREDAGSLDHASYLNGIARRFVARMSSDEQLEVLSKGDQWPSAALGALSKLPRNLDVDIVTNLTSLDRKIAQRDGKDIEQLRVGIVAVLARSADITSMAYLRKLFEQEPERRSLLAMGLAQKPEGENWPLLLRALPVLEDPMAGEVLRKLAQVDRQAETAEPIRQVILQGLKQKNDRGRRQAIGLLQHWTDATVGSSDDAPTKALAKWQTWFQNTYPNAPQATLPIDDDKDKYTFDQLYEHITNTSVKVGNHEHGAQVFRKAQCTNCHRFGTVGTNVGPDLSTVSQRFHEKEILEAIIFPSQVIPDRYATKTVYTQNGRMHTGVVTETESGGVILHDAEGKRTEIAADDIDEIEPNKHSSMPTGLLNSLTLDEITDLFAYLRESPRTEVTRRPKRE